MSAEQQVDLMLARLIRVSHDPKIDRMLQAIREEVLQTLEETVTPAEEANKKKFENRVRIVFFNTCDDYIVRCYRKGDPLWRELLHVVYHRQFLRLMVESHFWKKGYITREEREYMEEIAEEAEEKLISHAERILSTANYLRCYVKRMVRNMTVNYWSRKVAKKQMTLLFDDEMTDELVEGNTVFLEFASSYLTERPDSRLLQKESEAMIRKAFADCMTKLTPWQRCLIEISLDPEQNLYAAYERGRLIETALEKGYIKRRYTYQAVKNHANAALKLLKGCMSRALAEE
ncbi:MAG: hypothetical protein D6812_03650 [Deltaproteobacteria bacterium]|nr:MAG: hypothetical protein D6812_03650 [Deltaproteobacteria bacterium]